MSRLSNLTSIDIVMLTLYVGMGGWGVVAQFEPPITLVGAAGPALAHIVTLGILVFSVSSAVALIIDQGESVGSRSDVELPMIVGFIGAWGTYTTTAWLLVAGFGTPGSIPVLKVFAVLTTVMLAPFIVRFVALLIEAVRTVRLARKAQRLGIVDEKWNTIR